MERNEETGVSPSDRFTVNLPKGKLIEFEFGSVASWRQYRRDRDKLEVKSEDKKNQMSADDYTDEIVALISPKVVNEKTKGEWAAKVTNAQLFLLYFGLSQMSHASEQEQKKSGSPAVSLTEKSVGLAQAENALMSQPSENPSNSNTVNAEEADVVAATTDGSPTPPVPLEKSTAP